MTIKNINLKICTGCGICEDVCPNDVIRSDKNTQLPFIAYQDDCSTCFICEEECPEKAIEVDPTSSKIVVFPY